MGDILKKLDNLHQFNIFVLMFLALLYMFFSYQILINYLSLDLSFQEREFELFRRIVVYTLFWLAVVVLGFYAIRKKLSYHFFAILMFFFSVKMLFTSDFLHMDRYMAGFSIHTFLFMFVPSVVFLADSKWKKYATVFLLTLGFTALLKVHSVEGLFFYSFTLLLSLFIGLNGKNGRIVYLFTLVLIPLVFYTATKILYFLKLRKDPYLETVLTKIYTEKTSLLPDFNSFYTLQYVYEVRTDFITVFIVDNFGWMFGILLLLFPIFLFLYGLFKSVKALENNFNKAVFMVSLMLVVYSVLALLPLIPYFPKYGLPYPMYSFVDGFCVMAFYILFLKLFLRRIKMGGRLTEVRVLREHSSKIDKNANIRII